MQINQQTGDTNFPLNKMEAPIFKVLAETAEKTNTEIYVIGGFVRDLYLHRPSKDIDVVVLGNGIAFAEQVGQKLKPMSRFSRILARPC